MLLTKKRKEVLLSPGEWASVAAVHESASLDFEALARAVADVLSGRVRSLLVALQGAAEAVDAEQVRRAAHNWAVGEAKIGIDLAELGAADPLEVIQGVLFELADLHHQAHRMAAAEAAARKKGGAPRGGKSTAPSPKETRRRGRPPELGVTDDDLRTWEADRLARAHSGSRTEALRHYAKRRFKNAGQPHPSGADVERLAKGWVRRLNLIANRKK